jgi:C4-dicarboxylate transporter DctQ subunit
MTRSGIRKSRAPVFGALASVHDAITRFTFGVAMVASAYLTLALSWEVITRYVLRAPTGWVPDTAAVSFALITFMGAPMLAWKHGHVNMDIVVRRMPASAGIWVQRFVYVVAAGACLLCAWFGYVELLRLFKRNVMMIAVTPIPKWWLMAAIVYCLLSMGIYFLRHLGATFGPQSDDATSGGVD